MSDTPTPDQPDDDEEPQPDEEPADDEGTEPTA
jgi:hypothetical protein